MMYCVRTEITYRVLSPWPKRGCDAVLYAVKPGKAACIIMSALREVAGFFFTGDSDLGALCWIQSNRLTIVPVLKGVAGSLGGGLTIRVFLVWAPLVAT